MQKLTTSRMTVAIVVILEPPLVLILEAPTEYHVRVFVAESKFGNTMQQKPMRYPVSFDPIEGEVLHLRR